VADKNSSLKNAIMDLARGLETVFKKYTRSTRNKAWEKMISKEGEKQVARILRDPSLTVAPFGKLANQKD